MRRDFILNTTAATTGAFSFLGAFGHWILRALGFADEADKLSSAMRILADAHVSWPGIYLLILIGSICSLVAINATLLARGYKSLIEKKQREWNTTGIDIIQYIVNESYFGKTLERKHAREQAMYAILHEAKLGNLRLAGRRVNTPILTRISKRQCRRLEFNFNANRIEGVIVGFADMQLANKINQNERYVGVVFADREEIQRIWPPIKTYL